MPHKIHQRAGLLSGAIIALLIGDATAVQADVGIGDDALPGLIRTDTAEPLPRGLLLALSSGYGFTGEALDQEDSHHRGAGRLGLSYRLVPGVAIALRLDGRYDKHFGSEGRDDGWVGDPRLLTRFRLALGPSFSAGLQLGVWAPGSEAPSIEVRALSFESTASLSYAGPAKRFMMAANVGYRLDRSAASVDLEQGLSLADRMSLGVSDYNAVLAAAGVSYRLGRVVAAAEWSLDLLHGNGAPPFRYSPMRAGASLTVALSNASSLFVQGERRLSQVSAVNVSNLLLPFEPELQIMAGLQMRFGRERARPAPLVVAPVEELPVQVPDPEPPTLHKLHGRVLTGSEGIANARLQITGPEAVSTELTTDDSGSFAVELVPGELTVSIFADGFEPLEQKVVLGEDTPALEIYLDAILPPGQLRGVVRSFRGKPLTAELRIDPEGTIVKTADDGGFQIDLPPGSYEVTITVDGYTSQKRQILIEEEGVTIMNVDLRR